MNIIKSILQIILILIFSIGNVYSQNQDERIKLDLSSRVDTTNVNVKKIVKLYENYLNSRPDSIYNNPYWNSSEKEQYKDFDFSRLSIFQMGLTSNKLFRYYIPFVMSVEPAGDKYQIRILFSNCAEEPPYVGSKVWCIQKLSVVWENDKWLLENLIVDLTKKWKSEIYGFIEYVYPPNFNFNPNEAERAIRFCQNIVDRFNPSYSEHFKFYITNSVDDIGLLENFDYYFTGITTGKAVKGKILSAKWNEFYPHEFIHQLLPVNKNRGFIIEEGLAVFLGTKENVEEYKKTIEQLAKDIFENNEKINFETVVSGQIKWNGYLTAYPAGAIICEVVYKLKGDAGLKELMNDDTSDYENLLHSLLEISGLNKEKIIESWNNELKKYRKNWDQVSTSSNSSEK